MIVRRIAQHMKQQHWTGVFIELVIVILGVFIGLQADNWNTTRKQRQAESELVGELRSDLNSAIDIETDWVKSREKNMHDLEAGMTLVQGMNSSPSLTADECNALWKSGMGMITPPANPSLISLLSPGRISIIQDLKLRGALLSYASYHEHAYMYVERVESSAIIVADKYPDAFPRRLNVDMPNLSIATCNLQEIRTNRALQNNLLSNLGRIHGSLITAKKDLAKLSELKAEVDAYHP